MKIKACLLIPGKALAIFTALLLLYSGYAMAQNSNRSHPVTDQPFSVQKPPSAKPVGEAVSRLIRYEVKPGFLKEFREALSDYVLHALSIENNIMAEAYYEQEQPSVLWIIERWSSSNALDSIGREASFKTIKLLSRKALKQPARVIHVKDLEPISKQEWRSAANAADSPLTIMLFVDAKAGTQDTFRSVYHIAMPLFRSEPGVVTYQLSQLEEDDTQFVTYEKFRSNDAFQYHLSFPPIQPVIDYLHTSIKKQPFQDGLHKLIEFAPLTRE